MIKEVTFTSAFSAGFLSFFAPCVLPLVPPYFAWLLGIPQEELGERRVKTMLLNAFLLIVAFLVVFVILGASASQIGKTLAPYRLLVQRGGGLIIIFFGFEFIGVFKIFKIYRDSLVKKIFSKFNKQTSSLLVGFTFAFAWIACFSPILGSILLLSSFQKTLQEGVILLSLYSLGLALPFLLSALFLSWIMERIRILVKISRWINLFSGLILIIMGVLLTTDNFYKIVFWLNGLYPK